VWLKNCSHIYRSEIRIVAAAPSMLRQDYTMRTLKCLSAFYEKKEDKYGEKFNFDRR
jgi:hypothetical protein